MKRRILFIISFLFITIFTYNIQGQKANAATGDGDNDSFLSAYDASVNTDIEGKSSGPTINHYNYEWYAFTLTEPGKVTIQLNHPSTDSIWTCWRLSLYYSAPETDTSKMDEEWETNGHNNLMTGDIGLPAGKYYVKVGSNSDYITEGTPYTLRINYASTNNFEMEYNGSYLNSDVIKTNTNYNGATVSQYDHDWYTFSTTKSGYVSVSFSHPTIDFQTNYWIVCLYKEDGSYYRQIDYEEWSVDGNHNLKCPTYDLPAGKYYVMVAPYIGYYDEDSGSYSDSTYTLRVSYQDSMSNMSTKLGANKYSYTGYEIKPSVTVKNGSVTLKEGKDYKLSYKYNVNPGMGLIFITGMGNYIGTDMESFVINRKSLSACSSSLSFNTYLYSGAKKTPNVILKNGKVRLKLNRDYTVKYYNNSKPGTAKVTISGKGNYTGTITKTFKILPVNIKPSITSGSKYAKLSWKKVTGATGYMVYMSTSSKGKYTKVATVSSSTSFKKKGLTSGKKYYFKVIAFRLSGKTKLYSSYSSVVSVKVKK